MITKTAVPVHITNGIGELPCDLLRLLRAYGDNSHGARTGDAIEVMDENGQSCQEIQVAPSQLDYCAYEVIRILARDELVRGKMRPDVYGLFEEEAANHFQVAIGDTRQLSIDDMESTAWMLRNAQFFNLR